MVCRLTVSPSPVPRLPSHRPLVQFGNGFELDHGAISTKKSTRRVPICCLRQKKGLSIQKRIPPKTKNPHSQFPEPALPILKSPQILVQTKSNGRRETPVRGPANSSARNPRISANRRDGRPKPLHPLHPLHPLQKSCSDKSNAPISVTP